MRKILWHVCYSYEGNSWMLSQQLVEMNCLTQQNHSKGRCSPTDRPKSQSVLVLWYIYIDIYIYIFDIFDIYIYIYTMYIYTICSKNASNQLYSFMVIDHQFVSLTASTLLMMPSFLWYLILFCHKSLSYDKPWWEMLRSDFRFHPKSAEACLGLLS